jgi:hypothetical protein
MKIPPPNDDEGGAGGLNLFSLELLVTKVC